MYTGHYNILCMYVCLFAHLSIHPPGRKMAWATNTTVVHWIWGQKVKVTGLSSAPPVWVCRSTWQLRFLVTSEVTLWWAGVVLASPLWDQWGQRSLEVRGRSLENSVSYMCKYAVFDIKPTYNHSIFIPDVQLHLQKNFIWGQTSWLGGHGPLCSSPFRTASGDKCVMCLWTSCIDVSAARWNIAYAVFSSQLYWTHTYTIIIYPNLWICYYLLNAKSIYIITIMSSRHCFSQYINVEHLWSTEHWQVDSLRHGPLWLICRILQCLSDHISQKPHGQTVPIFYAYWWWMAQSYSGALWYVMYFWFVDDIMFSHNGPNGASCLYF